jgi:hypothetical protein
MLGKGLSGEIILQLRGKISRTNKHYKILCKKCTKKEKANIFIKRQHFSKQSQLYSSFSY